MSATSQLFVERIRRALQRTTRLEQLCADERVRLAVASDVRSVVAAYLAQRGHEGVGRAEVLDILAFVKDRQLAYVEHIETVCSDGPTSGS